MALAATVQWDVRTGGNDTNGGGFDPGVSVPGTDFSQQNTAQVAFTDLVIGGTNTQLTSAGNPFSSASVGNLINITSGTNFTMGWYTVVSVAGVTATMDRAVGTAASTGGHGNLGGSMATALAAINVSASSNTVWVKSGTYTQTTSALTTNSANPIYITGYNATHGDGGTAPILTSATNSIDIFHLQQNTLYYFNNITFSSTAGTRGFGLVAWLNAPYLFCINCTFDGLNTAVLGDNSGSRSSFPNVWLVSCEIKNSNGTSAVNLSFGGTMTSIVDCYIHSNTGHAITTASTYVTISDSIIAGNTGRGLDMEAGSFLTLINNTFAGNGNNAVFLNTGGNVIFHCQSNILYGNTLFGITLNTGALETIANRYNAGGSNGSGNGSIGTNTVAITAGPFTNSGSGDYSLNGTAGGGLACINAGYPGVFPGGTTTGHLAIGAVQTSTTVTTAGIIVTSGMDGGIRG